MGWHLPGWLKAILEGGYEPQADEDKLYALADQYDLCKKYLTEALPGRIDTAANGFGAAYHGEAGAALEDFLKRYARNKDFQGPATLADSAGYVAEFLRTMGDTVVRTKRELLIIGIVSWITILAGVGPILGTLIRKIGQEGVKQLLLLMLKKLVNREARKLQQKMLLEMLTAGTKQTTKFVFSREMVPKVLGVVGGELADELIPHAVAGWWGKLTGQDRRLAVNSDGQPQLDSQQRFVMTHDWDWRGTAMTAAGAVVGVPLSHGLGIGLAKVPIGKLARTFGNNAITSPLASSLTSLGFGEGWHTPSLQDAWIAGAHGAARGSTASDVHGPLESIGEAVGEYVGHKLISALPGGHPPAGPDGGVLQSPSVNHSTTADLSQETAPGLAHNAAANLGQNAAQNSSQAASQVSAVGTVGQSAVAPLTSTTPWTAAGRASAQVGVAASVSQQSRTEQEQALRRDPAGQSTPPADNGPGDNTDHEVTEATEVTEPTASSPSSPASRSSDPSLPADPSVQGSPSAQTAQSAEAAPPAAAPSSPDTASPQPAAALAQSAPSAQTPTSTDQPIDVAPVLAAQASPAPPPVAPVAPPTAGTSTDGGGASVVRGGAPELDPAGPARPSRVRRAFAGLRRGGVHPQLPGGRDRAFVADDNHLLYGDRAVTPHELATLARRANPEIVVDQRSAAATALAQKLADITGQDVVLRSSDGTEVLTPTDDRAARPDGVVVPEDGKLVRKPRATSAHGIEVEVSEANLGPRLGAGRSKTAFAFFDKVVLVAHPGVSLAAEIDQTNKLRALPGGEDVIAPIHAHITLFGRDAIVVDRFEASSHEILDEEAPDPDSRVTRPGLTTQATVDSLRALRAFALENHVLPGDLQFASTPDGRLRAYDVDGTRPVTGPQDPALTTLNAWLTWAETQLDNTTPSTTTPSTSAPSTSAPNTSAPNTSAPNTSAPNTSAPNTSAPNTSAPNAAPPKSPPRIIRRRPSSGVDDSGRARLRGPSDEAPGPREDDVVPAVLRGVAAYQGLSAAEQLRIREAILRLAGDDPVLVEGLRVVLESPGLRELGPAELLAEIEGWNDYNALFDRAIELGAQVLGSPQEQDVEGWASHSWDDATDLGELTSLPEKMSVSGRRGKVSTLDEHAGVYAIVRDGVEWITKLFPEGVGPEGDRLRKLIAQEFNGLVAAAGTGYGPTPYGLVRARIGDKTYIGPAMGRVQGAMVHDSAPSDPAAAAEYTRAREAVTFNTVLQLHQYLRRLGKAAYDSDGELQPLIDPDNGNFRVIDCEDVLPFVDDPMFHEYLAARGLSEESRNIRDRLIAAAIENARRARDRERRLADPVDVGGLTADDGGLTVDAVQQALDAVRARLRLPDNITLRFVVAANNDELADKYGIPPTTAPRPGYFRMDNGIGVVYLPARNHTSPADVAATVWHEVIGHYAWHLFSARTRADLLAIVHRLRALLPELSAEIDELYVDQPSDVRDEEFLARVVEDGVPRRIVGVFNALLATRIGPLLVHVGAIDNETLEIARHKHELAPVYRILRLLLRAVRANRPVVNDSLPERSRLFREHQDQPRGGAGSIHRSEFRGDGRGTPDEPAVRAAVHHALPQIARAVRTIRADVLAIGLSGKQITITLRAGEKITIDLDVSGTFTDAGPVRWERTAREGDWARITLSPQASDEVAGRAIAHAVAAVMAAYGGQSSDDQERAGREAEVGYLVQQIEGGGSPYRLRKELRLLLDHMSKRQGPPLPIGLQLRVEEVLHRSRVRAWVADTLVPWVDKQEDRATKPGLLGTKELPGGARAKVASDPTVDRFLHRLFQHFANQPDVAVGPGESASREKTLRDMPVLKSLVTAHGPAAAAALGNLTPAQFTPQQADQHAVAGLFDRLRGLVDQWQNAESWRQRRRAARQFAEMADALGVIDHDDLRAALPHDLATAVAEIEPGMLQRMNRFAGQWLPDLGAEMCFTFAEIMPASTATALVIAGQQDGGLLATTIFVGGAIAVPLRAALSRYVAVLEDLVITARRNYRQEQIERFQSIRRAEIDREIRTAGRRVLASAAEHTGQVIPTDQPDAPRPEVTPPAVEAPPSVVPWWTFAAQSTISVAVAAAPIVVVASPLHLSPMVFAAGIGLAAGVFGSAQYAFARIQARLDDERRIRDFYHRSRRQFIGELRRAADELVRLQALGKQYGDSAIQLPSLAVAPFEDHLGRGVVPGKLPFAFREVLLGVVPMVYRAVGLAAKHQLATSTATLLEAVLRVGATSVVSGVVEYFHAQANRHAFDRRMHNWLELLRTEVQKRVEQTADPVLARLDALLANPSLGTIGIPSLRPWSPVVHPEREATTNRRWYAVGAASIAAAGVGLSALMVFRFHVDPSYLGFAAITAASLPFSYYAKYLRRRMGVRADFDERDRAAERRAATQLDREQAAATDAAFRVARLEDVVHGLPPRSRPAPTTDLGRFIESERRDDHPSTELSRLLARLEDLDAEHQRVLKRYDTHQPTDLSQLTEVLLAISSTLSEYADASHELGVDPHLRRGGPMNIPMSASVLHHDPLNGRNLTDQTWDANRPIRPSVEAERAALIAAKIQQVTGNRYSPYSLAQIRLAASTGDQLVDIAADLVAAAERRRGPLWSRGPRSVAAKVDFRRSLVADQARAVPARVIGHG
ncbi:WXG100-like domain-containing protein [Kribbella sp. NPDC054772]